MTLINNNEVNKNRFTQFPEAVNKQIVASEGKDCKWGRLILNVNETNHEGKQLTHTYAACVNRENGDIYLDDSKLKIWTKLALLILFRPVHTAIKTIYHTFFFISIPHEVSAAIKRNPNITKLEIVKLIAKRLVDIVLTPIYGVVLTAISICAAFAGIFCPRKLYDFRDIAGKIDKLMYWDETYSGFELFKPAVCFLPIKNIHTIKEDFRKELTKQIIKNHITQEITRKYGKKLTKQEIDSLTSKFYIEWKASGKLNNDLSSLPKEEENKQIDEKFNCWKNSGMLGEDKDLLPLNKWALDQIHFRRTSPVITNNCYKLLGKEEVYTSPEIDNIMKKTSAPVFISQA